MTNTKHSITLHVDVGGRRVRLSFNPPIDYSPQGIDVTLDAQSAAFQALSQAWGKSLTQTGTAYTVCSPVILNYEGC